MRKTIIKATSVALLGLLLQASSTMACTNFLITKGASKDGSTIISYSADSHVLYGELYFRPARTYSAGTFRLITEWDTGKPLGKIAQVAQTYSGVGNMNEYQVTIGETTYGGREELVDTTAIIDYGSLIYIALERSKTAREAIKVMAELIAEYGYASEGESFSIADPNEVWILEMIGKGTNMVTNKKTKIASNTNRGAVWVAVRIPDGYVSGHANQARIRQFTLENMKTSISSKNMDKINEPGIEIVYAADVITFAREKKYFTGEDKDFSFSDTYAPVDFSAARFCEIRVWSMFKEINPDMQQYLDYVKGENLQNRMPLYVKPDRKISVHDVMTFMRDHLEGTELDMSADIGAGPHHLPYRWRPMTWSYNGQNYCHERATATQQTGWSYVAQMRSWLPREIGGILWFGVDDAASTVYSPMYCSMTRVPEAFAVGNGDMMTYSPTSAHWIFNRVSNFAYLRYDAMHTDVAKVQSDLESKYLALTAAIDNGAKMLYDTDPKLAVEFLTDYSVNTGNSTVKRWEELSNYLLVKYMDGNVKKEKDGKFMDNGYGMMVSPNQPALPEWWKKKIVEDTGNEKKVIGAAH
ncbi:dipeptidase [Williamwhitmania taraxaci]|uniref:Dipeptidase n=1 Tax=Williamwhitmania taraxaci TaxID=1640674 RepID=A0A1G6GLI4_9BACT|nr:C69 family dipeptidase [Williamwhitmania taraxaci]SDB82595.1 Dipeptidase [Williamwhitmania taraxaci]